MAGARLGPITYVGPVGQKIWVDDYALAWTWQGYAAGVLAAHAANTGAGLKVDPVTLGMTPTDECDMTSTKREPHS